MDLSFGPEYDDFRADVVSFLANNADKAPKGNDLRGEAAKDWQTLLIENGYTCRTIPKEYGGYGAQPDIIKSRIIAEEFSSARVNAGLGGQGISMLVPTLLEMGTQEQKEQFIRPTIHGEMLWCQGYSEPGAGSDLASLTTSAVLDGDEWVLNGQKIWTSSGHLANWIFVLGRTSPDEAKHQGITFFLCPMDQKGVEVRPIVNIAGHSHFNEVFFSDARVPRENVIGQVNGGWAVAMTLLGYERGFGATTTYFRYRAELDRLVEMAQDKGRTQDTGIRQRLAWCHSKVEIMRWLGQQVLTSFLNGEPPGPKSSIVKLNWSEYHRVVTELSLDILGSDAMLVEGEHGYAAGLGAADAGTPNTSSAWINSFLSARSGTIYAGTSQVQRNIIGERILGLPKEPRSDEGPWNNTLR